MSRKVKIDSLSEEQRDIILKELKIEVKGSSYSKFAPSKYVYPFDSDEDYVYIPFSYGSSFKRPSKDSFTLTNNKFKGTLRPMQKDIKSEAIKHLNKTGSSIISAYPGAGKTCLSIYISTKIGLKTLIITHRIVLIKQWKESLKKFCPGAKVQIVTAKKKLDSECDFYIMNATNVPKHRVDEFGDIGLSLIHI